MKVIIIGGVAAGMSTAAKLKRADKEAQITVYEKSKHVSFGACGLPYFVGNFFEDSNKMIARTVEQFNTSGITVNIEHEVLNVDTKSVGPHTALVLRSWPAEWVIQQGRGSSGSGLHPSVLSLPLS